MQYYALYIIHARSLAWDKKRKKIWVRYNFLLGTVHTDSGDVYISRETTPTQDVAGGERGGGVTVKIKRNDDI